MSTIIEKSVVQRRKGYLYFIDKQGNVRETKMARGGKKGRKVCGSPKKKTKKTTKAKAKKK